MTRGRLKVYLGAAPGVGTTHQMLQEGRRLAAAGREVVIGFADAHGRPATARQAHGLPVVPPIAIGSEAAMDLRAVLARAPQLVLVDDLSAVAGEGPDAVVRHEDVEVLLAAGIDVIATIDVRQLQGLADVVEDITGVRPDRPLPDRVVRAAEQIELVDVPVQVLRDRLAAGELFAADAVDGEVADLFRPGNLAALRELALRWLADRVDEHVAAYRAEAGTTDPWELRERVLVGIDDRPGGDRLVLRAARLAARTGADLVGVHVHTAREAHPDEAALAARRDLLRSVGGSFREVVARSVAEGLLAAARTESATQVVIGGSSRSRLSQLRRESVAGAVLRGARDEVDVHVVPGRGPGAGALPRAPGLMVISARRRLAGFALAVVGLLAITTALAPEAGLLGLGAADAPQVAPEALTAPLLLYLALTAAVSAVGGLWPGLVCATSGLLLGNAVFTQPRGSLSVASSSDIIALVVFLLISALVSTLTDLVVRRAAQTARARAEVRVLTHLAAAIATVDDPLARLTEEIRALFDLDGVALVRRTGDAWAVECATGDAPQAPAEADDQLRVDADRLLLLRGPRTPAEDRRLLAAVVTQLAVAATRRSLAETTTALRQASAANDLRTALLSAVSHDLRTPLASIKAGASSLLAEDVALSDDLVREFAGAIVTDADRLDRLVTNLLDMSRLQAGATEPLMQAVGLDEVIAAAVEGTSSRSVELRVPADVPDVWADPALLERVLANLVDNAVKASQGSRVVVWAARVPDGVDIRVIDYGAGIPADAVEAAFRPFQRLGDAPRGRGVGLGLAIARGFTDAMGGRLVVDVTPGGGTTMVLSLPVAASGAVRAPAVGSARIHVGG